MKYLDKLATEYAQKISLYEGCDNDNNAIKHDVAYHSFCDGFNEALQILMDIGNIKSIEFNFMEVEE